MTAKKKTEEPEVAEVVIARDPNKVVPPAAAERATSQATVNYREPGAIDASKVLPPQPTDVTPAK